MHVRAMTRAPAAVQNICPSGAETVVPDIDGEFSSTLLEATGRGNGGMWIESLTEIGQGDRAEPYASP